MLPALVQGVMEIGARDEAARATIGQIHTYPFSRNVVPGKVVVSVDLRHPDEQVLQSMHDDLTALITCLPGNAGPLTSALEEIWQSPVVAFDPVLVASVRSGAERLGYSHCDIVSGAGHDALMVARKAPTAMIFTPCRGGISHNEAEYIEPGQAEAGTNVLLAAVLNYLGN